MKKIILSRNFDLRCLTRELIKELGAEQKNVYVDRMNVNEANRAILLNHNWYTIGDNTILIDIPESVGRSLCINIESLQRIYDGPSYIIAHSTNINKYQEFEYGIITIDEDIIYLFKHSHNAIDGLYRIYCDTVELFNEVVDAFIIIKHYVKDGSNRDSAELINQMSRFSLLKEYTDEFINKFRQDRLTAKFSTKFISGLIPKYALRIEDDE